MLLRGCLFKFLGSLDGTRCWTIFAGAVSWVGASGLEEKACNVSKAFLIKPHLNLGVSEVTVLEPRAYTLPVAVAGVLST